ncbi:FAD-dependent monooxygenase [Streptomyces sp. NPDC005863]|uniref:FAD-dependent oxidoreductase n=1 Tax=unclassified Streptomyces TaxID=2593676 RepID=UPI0033DB0A99
MTLDAHGVDRSASGGRGHAVVIGASLAGLTAARALANSMDRVTLIERDRPPHGTGRRRGVPQARHTHTLTTTAQQGLEQLFPGIGADLERAGAVRLRMPQDMLLLGPHGWLPRFDCGLSLLSAGRDVIDAVIRERLRAEGRVAFLSAHEVVALQPDRNDTVTGVWARGRDRTSPDGRGPRRLIPADFVVDASGSGSRAPHWLAELGYEAPRESTAGARTTYVSTVFAPPVGHVADWQGLLLMASPGHPHQGTLTPIEGGRWSVTLCWSDGRPPPADHTALLHAAAALRHPLLHDVIEAATPLGPLYTCTQADHRWRHYEKLRRFPDQFLVLGDALAALDPAHGQGMTLAIQGALVLDHLLAGHGTTVGLTYRLRRALAHRLAPAWQSSTRHLRTTTGQDAPTGLRAHLGRRHTAKIAAAAPTDPHAATLLVARLQAAGPLAAVPHPTTAGPTTVRPAPGPLDPAPSAPPSSTHGPHGPRTRRPAPRPADPAIGVATGSALLNPPGSSAQWPPPAPAAKSRRT